METSLDLFDLIQKKNELDELDMANYSPLTLAYIGDAIYEIVIRTIVVAQANSQVNKLHKRTSNLVKAPAQAKMILSLMDELTEEEKAVYKRGRNAKSVSMAKNATMSEYRTATGFEALMGYLYLSKQSDRMLNLIKDGIQFVDEKHQFIK